MCIIHLEVIFVGVSVVWVLVSCIALGVLGQQMLSVSPDLSSALWIWMVIGAAFGLIRLSGDWPKGHGRWLLGLGAVFAGMLAVYQSETLDFLNSFGVLVCLALGAFSRQSQLLDGGIAYYANLFPHSQLSLNLFQKALAKAFQNTHFSGHHLGAIARGLLIALPLIVVFGILLASADPNFSRLLTSLLDFRFDSLVFLESVFWISVCLVFFSMVVGPSPQEPLGDIRSQLSLGNIEIVIILGAVNSLFALFIGLPFSHLFGGLEHLSSLDLTYAEYARGGFFELITVALLMLPILLLIYRLKPPQGPNAYTPLALLSIACLGLMLASACQRMLLYISAYGLTPERIVTLAFMAWLAFTLVWFVYTVLRGRYNQFTFPSILAGLCVILVLNLLNPDRLSLQYNLTHGKASYLPATPTYTP
jgi:hypothetical protein